MGSSRFEGLIPTAVEFIQMRWVEIIGILFVAAIVTDLGIYSGGKFVNSIKTWASNNNGLASLILSASLLYAYFLQFRAQDRQRVLMNQQKEIMDAGYTPLVGITEQKVVDHSSNPEILESEIAKLTIVNRGNSIATDLKLHFQVSYEKDDQRYTDHCRPLRRTEDGVWWQADSGGSISPEESEVKFSTPAKIIDRVHHQAEPVDISEAIDQIFDSEDINRIEISTRLYYKDAKENQKNIDLTTYTIKSSDGETDLKLSNANSRAINTPEGSEEVEEIIA